MSRFDLLQTLHQRLADDYGIVGTMERLPGENLNFLVTGKRGQKHILKIVDEDMPPEVVALEFAVLERAVAGGFRPRLPRILETRSGEIETRIKVPKIGILRCRIIEFIHGVSLADVTDISKNLLQNLGRALAEFDLALENFDHPAAHRQHRWNLADVYQHEAKVSLIDEPGKRALLDWAFATWKAALPQLDDLPWQVIHGDAHDENVLVGGDEVVGLIDFGDCCYNPTVCELAICLAYMMMRGEAFHIARSIVRGYEGVRSLTPKERKVMYPLICGRLAASLCIANERKLIDPDHPNWFGGERRTWAHLQTLRQLGGRAFEARCMLPV